MRRSFLKMLLVTSSVVLLAGNYAIGCGDYGDFLPRFERGIKLGSNFLGVDSAGQLVSSNLRWGNERCYGSFDRALLSHLDAQGDRAVVLTLREVCEVDLKSGKIVRSQKHDMGMCGVGIIDKDNVFLQNGLKLVVFNLESGKVSQTVDLKSKLKKLQDGAGAVQISHSRVGNLLYIARPYTNGAAVVDLEAGKLVKEIKTPGYGWASNVHVANDKMFVRQWSVSYGIRRETLFLVDLKSDKSLKQVSLVSDRKKVGFTGEDPQAPTTMLGTQDGGVLLTIGNNLMRFDAKGTLVSKATQKQDVLAPTRLIAPEKGAALIADAKSIRAVKLTPMD